MYKTLKRKGSRETEKRTGTQRKKGCKGKKNARPATKATGTESNKSMGSGKNSGSKKTTESKKGKGKAPERQLNTCPLCGEYYDDIGFGIG